MKVNELMIGNYVYFHGDVEEINMVDGFGIIGREEQPLCSIDEFEPIPLTEEWLLRFGGKPTIVEDYPIYFIYPFNIEYYENECIVLIGGFSGIKIKYLHQLQNLYFALTGKELILN